MTQIIPTAPLAPDALAQCQHCGSFIWTYATYSGVQLALTDAPGPVVIDGQGMAFKTEGRSGYQEHECAGSTHVSPFNQVADDDFLWP